MIGLVNYGLGNIQAFANIYSKINVETFIVSTPYDLRKASKLILPGVGSFDWALSCLQKSGLRDALDEEVLGAKKPILGICVGMQIMAKSSEEGSSSGLGWLDMEVSKFDIPKNTSIIHMPHIGWNDVEPIETTSLFHKIKEPRYYFLHSYFMNSKHTKNTIATSYYGRDFPAAVCKKNIFGTQFHPEKSHQWGIKLLKNFAEKT